MRPHLAAALLVELAVEVEVDLFDDVATVGLVRVAAAHAAPPSDFAVLVAAPLAAPFAARSPARMKPRSSA